MGLLRLVANHPGKGGLGSEAWRAGATRRPAAVTLGAAVLLFGGVQCGGQHLDTGQAQVRGFGGLIHARAGEGWGSWTKGVFGGGAGVGVLRRVALFGDYWSIPAVKESATVSQYGVSATTRSSSKLQGFEGGVHLHLGDTDAPVVPYVLGSVGWGHQSWEETVVVGTGASRRTYTEKESDTGLQVGGGLGARLYLGKNWGVQPEFSVNRALDTEPGCPAVTIVRAQVGVFYQFGK